MKRKGCRRGAALLISVVLTMNFGISTLAEDIQQKATEENQEVYLVDYARGKTVLSDDEIWPMDGNGNTFAASNVTDGKMTTRWAPRQAPCSLIVDLDEEKEFDRIVVKESKEYSGRIKNFQLLYSDDGSNYRECHSGGAMGTNYTVDLSKERLSARYIKLVIQSTNDTESPNIDAVEVYNTKDMEWSDFLNDVSWMNELDVNGAGEAPLIDNPNGGKLQLEVTERPYKTKLTESIQWSIDQPQIAVIDQNGLVTAKQTGSVTVTARALVDGIEKTGSLVVDILDDNATYKNSYESLAENYEIPEWFQDAKFGIFIHWGVYSVPAYHSEWISGLMYSDEGVKNEMIRRYGSLSKHGYKDFIPYFTADQYDAEAWAALFKEAGAKYVVPVAEHHDGVTMYDSEFTRWNMALIGAKKDLIQPLRQAVKNEGMKFGVSNHFLENEIFYDAAKNTDADAANPKWFDLYNNAVDVQYISDSKRSYSSAQMQDWYSRSKELVDKFEPDLIWYDWTLDNTPYTAQLLSYYYNRAERTNPEGVVVNYKFNLPENVAVYDIERGQAKNILERPWQTDTSISDKSWGYIDGDVYKNPVNLLDLLIDVVSKNGNLLLNVGPDSRGRIPDGAQNTLKEMGSWLNTNGEAIYATRPWHVFGEGPTSVGGGTFAETNAFTVEDIRFTVDKEGKNLYVIGMKWPENGNVSINSLNLTEFNADSELAGISLLGSKESVRYVQDNEKMTVYLPENSPNKVGYPYVLKLEMKNGMKESVHAVSSSQEKLYKKGGKNKISISGRQLKDGIQVKAFSDGAAVEEVHAKTYGNDTLQKAVLTFPENRLGRDLNYQIKVSFDGITWNDTGLNVTQYCFRDLLENAEIRNNGNNWAGEDPQKALDRNPLTRWSSKNAETDYVEIDLGTKQTFNYLEMDEYVNSDDEVKGRIESFTISYQEEGEWKCIFDSSVSGDYSVERANLNGAWFDETNNLYRSPEGKILQHVHKAEFEPVTGQKIRLDFTVNKEISVFELQIGNRMEEIPEVLSVEVTPENAGIEHGQMQQFTAKVETKGGADQTVIWKVTGNISSETIIDQNGLLKVAFDETSKYLTIKAESVFDASKYGEAVVSVKQTLQKMKKVPEKGTVHQKGRIYYTITKSSETEGTVEVKKPAKKTYRSISIPDIVIIDGYKFKVTGISKKAFYKNIKLKKVVIGHNVSKIGYCAFAFNKRLKSVEFGKGLTLIEKKAFYKDVNLTKIVVKSSKLKKVKKGAFQGIAKNAAVNVPNGKTKKYKKMLLQTS